MGKKIIIVDDDANLLSGIRRQLKGKYELETFTRGKDVISYMESHGDVALVISDYKMPGMDGVAVLFAVKEKSPMTVRMMLTGQADMEAVVDIVNQGNIFRFLTKPCPPDLLIKNIDDGLEQYSLMVAEKELLSKTLGGSLQVMADLLVLAKPVAFNRSIRIREIVKMMLPYIASASAWQIEIAAMLSQVGSITIPDRILNAVYQDKPLDEADMFMYKLQSRTTYDMLIKIPRLAKVAEIILYQDKYYNGTGMPNDNVKGENLPLGARIIRLAMDYDSLVQKNKLPSEAVQTLAGRKGWYDEELLAVLIKTVTGALGRKKYIAKKIMVNELKDTMYLSDTLLTASGVVVGTAKQKTTRSLIITIKNYVASKELMEPIGVLTYEE